MSTGPIKKIRNIKKEARNQGRKEGRKEGRKDIQSVERERETNGFKKGIENNTRTEKSLEIYGEM